MQYPLLCMACLAPHVQDERNKRDHSTHMKMFEDLAKRAKEWKDKAYPGEETFDEPQTSTVR